VRTSEIQIRSSPLGDELINHLRESVYKSSSDPAAEQYLVADQLASLDDVCFYLGRARYEFYFREKMVAQQILNEMKDAIPGSYEADLLQAEFSARMGLNEDARRLLTTLIGKPAVPEWIKLEADRILNQIP
jgi:hypothetical protein